MIIVKVFVTGSMKLPIGNLTLSVDMEYYLYLLIGYVNLRAGLVDK
jgi:hypothetical protein